MSSITARVIGLEQSLAALDNLERKTRRKFARRSATKGGRAALKVLKRNAPRLGGGLRRSMDSKVVVYPNSVVVVLGQNASKARNSKAHQKAAASGKFAKMGGITGSGEIVPIHLVDQPTAAHVVRPRSAKALRIYSGRGKRAQATFIPSVRIKAQRGANFVEKTALEAIPQARRIMEADLSEQLAGL